MRSREDRLKVLIRARVKTEAGWSDACIVDLSRRGAGLQSSAAPRHGSYVEIRRGLHVIIARVVWSREQRFGVVAQDELPIDSIANDRRPASKPCAIDGTRPERRRLPRSPSEQGEASRRIGQRMQFAGAILAGLAAAMIAGAEVQKALASPLGAVGSALSAR